jgi:plastocyanin
VKPQTILPVLAVLTGFAGVMVPHRGATAQNGSITGMVVYQGVVPKPETIEVTRDQDVCGGKPIPGQDLIVAGDGGVANAVVALEGPAATDSSASSQLIKFDQKGCQYIPRVLAFTAGSTVEIINSDGILHSIHTHSTKNQPVNLAQPGFKKTIDLVVRKPEIIEVTCDEHNWMKGWWFVAANPYFAVTGADGRFVIAGVPSGQHKVEVWHEVLGKLEQTVTVKPGVASTVTFTYPAIKRPGVKEGAG